MGTGQAGEASENRPMTAVRAAGYSAAAGKGGAFDPANLGQAGRGPAPPLQKRAENSPEDACREMEKEVNSLIEESSLLSLKREHGPALEKAKEVTLTVGPTVTLVPTLTLKRSRRPRR